MIPIASDLALVQVRDVLLLLPYPVTVEAVDES